MKGELVHFLTTDSLRLPGLLFNKNNSNKVALYLHGNGTASIFYSPLMNILADELAKHNTTFFPFNNRGAHLIKSLKRIKNDTTERVTYGTAYELINECVFDIDGAIEFLKTKGFDTFYLIGESTGANKIVVYHYLKKKSPFTKYVLLAGGDDTGIYYREQGETRFKLFLSKAQQKIKAGSGTDLVPPSMSPMPYSFQSLYDVMNPDGLYNIFPFTEYANNLHLSSKKLFSEFQRIDKQTLVIYGEMDEYCFGSVKENCEILKKHTSNKDIFTFEVIPGADHGFTDKETELSKIVASWMASS
jgi:pimeloyl-ACP methyl ester carboxylesterase